MGSPARERAEKGREERGNIDGDDVGEDDDDGGDGFLCFV